VFCRLSTPVLNTWLAVSFTLRQCDSSSQSLLQEEDLEELLQLHDEERSKLHSEVLTLQMSISNLESELKVADEQVRCLKHRP
jgi:uncharacterized protein YlxW (UPF0749 family)